MRIRTLKRIISTIKRLFRLKYIPDIYRIDKGLISFASEEGVFKLLPFELYPEDNYNMNKQIALTCKIVNYHLTKEPINNIVILIGEIKIIDIKGNITRDNIDALILSTLDDIKVKALVKNL